MEGIGGLVVLILVIVPVWRICTRAGFSGWWSLLVVVPLLNLIMLWIFAYAKWPRDAD